MASASDCGHHCGTSEVFWWYHDLYFYSQILPAEDSSCVVAATPMPSQSLGQRMWPGEREWNYGAPVPWHIAAAGIRQSGPLQTPGSGEYKRRLKPLCLTPALCLVGVTFDWIWRLGPQSKPSSLFNCIWQNASKIQVPRSSDMNLNHSYRVARDAMIAWEKISARNWPQLSLIGFSHLLCWNLEATCFLIDSLWELSGHVSLACCSYSVATSNAASVDFVWAQHLDWCLSGCDTT